MTLLNKLTAIGIWILTLVFAGNVSAADPSLQFNPASLDATLNQSFDVTVLVDTAGFAAGGVGTIINFDPFMLSATSIKTGLIFTDYPMSSINNERGKISISGVASSSDHLFSGSGEFATITFTPKQLGFSSITFSFQPGLTTDSNIAVTFGNGDILTKVNKLNLNIVSPTSLATPPPDTLLTILKTFSLSKLKTALDTRLATINLPFISNRYASARSGRAISKNLDPLEPIVAQAPITDPLSNQPTSSINIISSNTPNLLPYVIIIALIIVIIVLIIILYKRV